MLRLLRIRNLAVIEQLEWELAQGLNILTGETGAGKSILIDAFYLLLGERADRTLLRDGADSCSVEAELTPPALLKTLFQERDIDWDDEALILKRTFTVQGQSRQSVNGCPVNLQTLKQLGDCLVDMHGPHDHQSLLSNDSQLDALDAYAQTGKLLEAYREIYREREVVIKKIEALDQAVQGDWERHAEMLKYQIDEITQAELQAGEDERVEQEYRMATHQSKLLELGQSMNQMLLEGEGSVAEQIAKIERALQEWEGIDPVAGEWRRLNNDALTLMQELAQEVDRYVQKLEWDEAQLSKLETRLNLIQNLKRKYGNTLPQILENLENFKQEFDSLSHHEQRKVQLVEELDRLDKHLNKSAQQLTAERVKQAPLLAEKITSELKDLGFNKARFEVSIKHLPQCTSKGKDSVEFIFAPNVGESPRPLKAIASSGEMARVMLAIKTVMAEQDAVPILIFDEIDANVGGETAIKVGKKLAELGKSHQVLCITHLPQVASAGKAHFRVEKEVKNNRSYTHVRGLTLDERKQELARMLGGESDASLVLASNMLGELNKKPKGTSGN